MNSTAVEKFRRRWRDSWDYLYTQGGDKRTRSWPLLGSPVPLIIILGLYYLFVKWLGPKMMEKRKPYQLNRALVIHNAVQIAMSSYLVYEAFDNLWLNKYSFFKCESIDWEVNETSMRICRGFYIYFLAKVLELLDTVFFVLRKKYNQITFLHVYHHFTMLFIAWGGAKYFPGGHGAFLGTINSIVHVIMYSYYMLSALGPRVQKYLWWKKWITILQLVQFGLTSIHFLQVPFATNCNYPKFTVLLIVPNSAIFTLLFTDFYKKAYKPRELPEEKSVHANYKCVENGKKQE